MTGTVGAGFSALDELRTVSAAFEAEVRHLEASQNRSLEGTTSQLDWTGRELVAHLSAIYRWCAEVVASGNKVIREPEGTLTGSAADWFSESREILLATLSARKPEEPAYTFQRDNRTVAFWHRRMLHETLVHLWDLRSILNPDAPAPAEVRAAVLADGVTELFEAFAGRVDDALRATFTGTLMLRATDAEGDWLVGPEFRLLDPALNPDLDPALNDDSTHAADTTASAGATVSGPAGAILLLVWNRRGLEHPSITVDGDAQVAAEFSAAQLHP